MLYLFEKNFSGYKRKDYLTELPPFTGCEIQGLFQDFPGLFQVNPGLSLANKTWRLYIFFQNQFNNTRTVLTSFIIQLYKLIILQIMIKMQKENTSFSTMQHHLQS